MGIKNTWNEILKKEEDNSNKSENENDNITNTENNKQNENKEKKKKKVIIYDNDGNIIDTIETDEVENKVEVIPENKKIEISSNNIKYSEIFDILLKNITANICDTFSRFSNTNEYKEYIKLNEEKDKLNKIAGISKT